MTFRIPVLRPPWLSAMNSPSTAGTAVAVVIKRMMQMAEIDEAKTTISSGWSSNSACLNAAWEVLVVAFYRISED
jgi:hypothetical protein